MESNFSGYLQCLDARRKKLFAGCVFAKNRGFNDTVCPDGVAGNIRALPKNNKTLKKMALTQCHECGKPVSTEAAACPNCGAPPRQNLGTPPSIPAAPSAPPQESNRPEETLYTDNRVTVTTTRVIIGNTTYALRNITSVKPASTTPSAGCAILLLIGGLLILAVAMAVITKDIGGGLVMGVFGAAILGGAILWFRNIKATYHMLIASASGEAKALSSPDKAYIQKVVDSLNNAIVKYR